MIYLNGKEKSALNLFPFQSKHRRKKEEARLEEKRKLLLKKHPLQILIKVKCKGMFYALALHPLFHKNIVIQYNHM